METLHKLNKMMQTFKGLHLSTAKTEQTFMQLTDYPHLENVCSNVLAFFFHTEESHGFKDLLIKSLLECAGKVAGCRRAEMIERELATDKGNRIDIFIETDKHLIAIENKVFSGVNNPLADYEAHTHKLNLESQKEPVFILLTLKEEGVDKSAFINVTYAKLFAAVRKNLGAYVVNADTKWTVMLNDFIRTIEELQGGIILNREFIEFYNENEATIDALLQEKKQLPKAFKTKIQSVMRMVSMEKSFAEGEYTTSYSDCSAEYYLTDNGLKQIGAPVHWVIYMDTKVCNILVGIDEATVAQRKSLEKFLADRALEYSQWEDNGDYFLVRKLDVFDADDVIAKEFQSLLNY